MDPWDQTAGVVTVSVVSHLQRDLVGPLLEELAPFPEIGRVVLTHNMPEQDVALPAGPGGRVKVLHNKKPGGFGENHNAAFRHCTTPYFCVLNPDIQFIENPFPVLLEDLQEPDMALMGPRVINPEGEMEDSLREFPGPLTLLARKLGGPEKRYAARAGARTIQPEWMAGMFMLFRSEEYRAIGGFDEGYFLYCEDTDICLRLRRAGKKLGVSVRTRVVHDSRRDSRRKLRYMSWHVRSMGRLWVRHLGRRPPVSS